jgi:uncharacterized protein YjiS (DUF1127 family)
MSCGSTTYLSTEPFVSTSEPSRATDGAGLNPLGRWIAAAKQLCGRRRQRRALLKLDDRMLADIGLSRQQAEQEGRKPFWQ